MNGWKMHQKKLLGVGKYTIYFTVRLQDSMCTSCPPRAVCSRAQQSPTAFNRSYGELEKFLPSRFPQCIEVLVHVCKKQKTSKRVMPEAAEYTFDVFIGGNDLQSCSLRFSVLFNAFSARECSSRRRLT